MSSVTIDQLNPVSTLQLNAKVEIQQDAVSYSATVQQILDLSPSGSGNVVGPSGGATNNALARYDGRTGLIIKNSLALLSDSGQLSNVKLAANVEVSNALIYASDVRQMFSPGDTNAGINVGSHATNPTAPINGDLIYNLTTRLFQFYQGNNWVALGSGTGSPLTTKGDIYVYSTVNTRLAVSATAGQVLTVVPSADSGLGWTTITGGSGDVDGPSVSIENALVRFDGATGKIIKNSGTLLSDAGHLSNVKLTTDVEVSNSLVYGSDVRQTFNPGNTRAGLNVGSNGTNPSAALNGDIIYNSASNLFQFYQNNVWAALGSGTGSGDVTGPGSATDDAIVTFDGTTGKLIQNSLGILDENGNLSAVTLLGVAVGQALVYDDGIKQIFNPTTTNAGINIGAEATDPSAGVDGDMYFDSASGKFRVYEGAWIDMIRGGGTVTQTPWQQNIDAASFQLGSLGYLTFADKTTASYPTTVPTIFYSTDGTPNEFIFSAQNIDTIFSYYFGGSRTITLRSDSVTMTGNLTIHTGSMVLDNDRRQIFNPGNSAAGINVGANATDPTSPVNGDIYYQSGSVNKFRFYENGAWVELGGGGGTGDVTGPGTATDNSIARFDGTTGKLIQNSSLQLSDSGAFTQNMNFTRSGAKLFFTLQRDLNSIGSIAELSFSGMNANNAGHQYAEVLGGISSPLVGNEDGILAFSVSVAGSMTEFVTMNGDTNETTMAKYTIFSPGASQAGLNVGAASADPSVPVNGDMLYNSALNKFRAYQNGAWVDMITSVTSLLTTKGDLISRSNVDVRLGVGTAGQVLTVDASTATGIAWATPSSGGSPLTKKGDLYTYSDTDIRLPVGSDGQILSADSTTTIGIAWITPGSGGNVSGPTASTMNAIPTYGNLVGDTLLNSAVTIATDGSMTFPVVATVSAGLFNVRQAIALSSVSGLSDVNGRMTRTATQWAVSTPEFVIRNTETSAGAHTLLGIVKIDATPANNDIVSGIRFQNDNNGLATYASIITAIENVNTLGLLNFNVRTSNSETLTTVLQVRSTGISLIGVIQFSDNIRQTFNPGSASSGLNVGGNAADPSTGINGDIYYNSANDKFRAYQGGSWVDVIGGGTGTGDVDGPSSAATNQIAVFDGTSGKRIKTSFATVSSTGGLNTGKLFFQLDRDTNTNGDSIAEIQFRGRSASAATTQYAEIIAGIGSSTTSAEAGTLSFSVVRASAITAFITLDGVSGTVQMVQHTTFLPTIAKAGLNIGTLALDPTAATVGDIYYNRTTFRFRGYQNGMWLDLVGVRGPATATENALARFDGTTGQLLQDSTILQDANDDLNISGHNLKGATGILDTNGLSLLTFTPVANSVNYINIRPASGSNAPLLTTVGTANNIGLQIVPKGSGTVLIGTTGNFNYQRILEIRGGNTQARSPGLRFSVSITNSFVIPAATITATGTGSAPNIVGFLSVYLGAASSPIFVLGDAAITSNTLFKFQKSVLFAGVTAPTSTNGALYFSSSLNKFQFYQNSGFQSFVQGAGTVGDNKVPTFNGTTGDIIQQSGISIDDDHNLISVNSLRSGVNRTFLQLHDVNLATNYIEITNAVTSSAPFISVGGSDSNIHLRFQAKGNGQLVMNSIVNLQAFSVIRVGGLFYDEQILTPAATHAFSIAGVDKVNVTLTSAVTTVTFTNLVAGGQLRVVFIAGSDTRTVNFPTTGHSDYTTGSFVIASGGIAILSIDCPTTSATDLIFNIKVYD